MTVGRKGGLSAAQSSGEYILTVEVATEDKKTKKPYDVWVDKRRYELLKSAIFSTWDPIWARIKNERLPKLAVSGSNTLSKIPLPYFT